jgi:general secretion pathway protein C
MLSNDKRNAMKHLPVMTSFVLFIALCVSLAYWAMQLFKPKVHDVAVSALIAGSAPGLDAAAGLFGGHLNTVVTSNYQLIGVIFASDPDESVAILATDGKPAQAIRTHREVAPGVTLNEVNRHYVLLSEGGVIKRIELPENIRAQIK